MNSIKSFLSFKTLLAISAVAGHSVYIHAEQDVVNLNPFVVDASGDSGYFATNSLSGSRTNMVIQDLPQSLIVITEEMLKDLSATSLFDALEYAGGVVQGPERDTPNSVIIRGFATDWPLRNGIKRVGAMAEPANIARIEVVKGPASILYGQSGLGGVVNYITKTPVSGSAFGNLNLTVGSYDHYRAELDYNLPLTQDGKWLSRFIGAVQSSNSFIQNYKNDLVFFAPSLEWRPTSTISWRLDGEYYLQNQTAPVAALPRYNHPDRVNRANSYLRARELDGLVPVDRSYNVNPEGTYRDIETVTLSSDFRWTLADGIGIFDRLTYRNVLYYHDVERDQLAALVGAVDRVHQEQFPILRHQGNLALGPLEWRDTAIWSPSYLTARNEVYTIQNEISMNKEFSRSELRILLGQEYFRDERTTARRRLGGHARGNDLNLISRVPIFAPTLDGASFPSQYDDGSANAATFQQRFPDFPVTAETFDSPLYTLDDYNRLEYNDEINVVNAYYFSGQLELMDKRLTLMAGFRYDEFDNRNRQTNRNGPAEREDRDNYDYSDPQFTIDYEHFVTRNTSPQLGASYKFNENFNIYALYSEGVFPNNNLNLREGVELKPQSSEGFDIGGKFQLWEGRFNGTLAYFEIDRSNLPRPVTDPDTNEVFQELGGLHRSRGYEFDFLIAPADNWQLFGGYTYLDAKYRQDIDPRNDGTRLAYVPRHRFSVLTKYNFTEGTLDGFHAGVGFVYQSDTRGVDTPGEANVAFVIPGHVKWDLIAGYKTRIWQRDVTFSAKLENVFDKTYVPNRLQGYGRPRYLTVKMNLSF